MKIVGEALTREELALDNCDREPIHRPGRTQPFGVLLAGPLDLSRIEFVSENADGILGRPARGLLGASFQEVLDRAVLHDVRNLLAMGSSTTQRERAGRYELDGRRIEVFVHRNPADQAVIELEPLDDDEETIENPVDRMRLILGQASRQRELNKFLRVCVLGLQGLVGYDRVMAYRYTSEGDGEVVAEARSSGIESFLGLRYPAQDVPTQSRALQVRNPVRMLVDVEQKPVALLGHTEDPDTLDMSLAHLRGISPIHVEYLRNMGVGATLTIGLVVEGRLWGMFACHHMSPRVIRSDVRIAAELFGQMISLLIQQRLELEATEARARAEEARRRILAETDATSDLLHAFPELGPILRTVIDADGLGVLRDGKVQTLGSVPSSDAIRAIGDRAPDDDNLIDATDALAASGWTGDHETGEVAGSLLIRCTAAAPLQILYFRDEKTRNIRWAGNPVKTIEDSKFGPRLHPRSSFEIYLEEHGGRAPDWTAFDLEAARELQKLLTQITTRGERAQLLRHKDLVGHQRQQELMIAELNHRVKNILALIRSLSRQAKASSASLESYAQALEQRISALAAAHDLAVSNTMQGVSLRGILETEMQPYLTEESNQALLSGPVVGLRADVAPMIALVFHEIVTNAAKYGALSDADGVVRAKWSVDEEGLRFAWREMGGPEVTPPTRNGFGRSLIEKAIPYEFDGEVTLAYPPSGVTLDFRLPPAALVDMTEESDVKLVGSIGEIRKVATGTAALMVEDNIVLAMDMVESLTRLGADSVDTAGTVEEAMRAVRGRRFDFAVLDMNLRGSVSFEIAERLREDGTPFVFVTGYGSTIDLPETLADVPILTKPIDDGALSNCLERLLA